MQSICRSCTNQSAESNKEPCKSCLNKKDKPNYIKIIRDTKK